MPEIMQMYANLQPTVWMSQVAGGYGNRRLTENHDVIPYQRIMFSS